MSVRYVRLESTEMQNYDTYEMQRIRVINRKSPTALNNQIGRTYRIL